MQHEDLNACCAAGLHRLDCMSTCMPTLYALRSSPVIPLDLNKGALDERPIGVAPEDGWEDVEGIDRGVDKL